MFKLLRIFFLSLSIWGHAEAFHIIDSAVSIGDSAKPDSSAILDLHSTSKGFLPPRMTNVQMSAIASPATALTVFDTTAGLLKYWDGAAWVRASGEGMQPWVTAYDYVIGDVVYYNNVIYVALTNHTSGTFATDYSGGAWARLGATSISAWLTATDYVVGDFVHTTQKLYRCIVAHTSGTFATDFAALKWEEVSSVVGHVLGTANQITATDSTANGTTTLSLPSTINATNLNLSGLTASLPVQTNGSNDLVSAAITLSGSQVTGVLGLGNGGTGMSTTGASGNIPRTNSGTTALEYVTTLSYTGSGTGGAMTVGGTLDLSRGLILSGTDRNIVALNSLGIMHIHSGSTFCTGLGATSNCTPQGAVIDFGGSGSGSGTLALSGGSGAGNGGITFNTSQTLRGTVDSAGLLSWLTGGITSTGKITGSNTTTAFQATGPLVFDATLPTIKNDTDAKELLLQSGSTAGSAGAFITLDGSSYAGTPGNVVINAGSGPGSISMKIDAAEALGVNSSGLVSIGASGGTQVHNINGHATLPAQGEIRFQDSSGGEYVGLKAPATATTTTYSLPTADGASGTVLKTDGAGNMSWVVQTAIPSFVGVDKTADYTITDGDGYSVISVSDTPGSGTGTSTVTLPTLADNQNRRLIIKNITSDQGTVLVDGEGAETIDGLTNVSLDFKNSYIELQAMSGDWKIVGTNITSPYKTCSITTTGTNWTQSSGVFIPYRQAINSTVWRMKMQIRGGLSSGATSFVLTVPNVTFAATYEQALSYAGLSSLTNDYGAKINAGASTIQFTLSAADDALVYAADAFLSSKPSCVE